MKYNLVCVSYTFSWYQRLGLVYRQHIYLINGQINAKIFLTKFGGKSTVTAQYYIITAWKRLSESVKVAQWIVMELLTRTNDAKISAILPISISYLISYLQPRQNLWHHKNR